MSTARPRGRGATGPLAAAALALAVLSLAGCAGQGSSEPPARQAQNAAQGETPGGPATGAGSPNGSGGSQAAPALARSEPEKITIPSLGVSSTLETLRQDKDGVMKSPKDPDLAGWYEPGPTPGSKGPAVIAGHVTWNGAAAVFAKLKTMKAGDTIEVARQDGKTAMFTVERVAEYPKAKFPTLEVYKNLDYAGLRQVTCGGEFDTKKHYYDSNVVVFARMTGTA
ncbi:class F sortase [Streptomyces sp. H39-S7]|uniref:class F sortase n=1 Tax=Streptomyces sp. H39-S7 TaxID=3004357 RepID=UPI0022AEA2EC|nr:class F sortase [Streptomyces sp. H39-S7]MCZ4126176.1 class F sortase [Streptomyces sp. H39-S7]